MSERRRRRQREEEEARMREEQRRRRIARERRRRRQIIRRRRILAGLGVLILIIAVAAGIFTIRKKQEEKRAAEALQKQKEEEEAAKAEEENNTLRMVAVGDNLIHETIIEAGKENDWNFDFLYENIKKDIKKADLASVNQETPLVKDHEAAAGYPDFSTPMEVGDALADAGFDIVTQATEHAFDQESDGVARSVSFWKKNHSEITLLGIHSSEEEDRYQIIEKKNFKVAVMNYSCMLSENHSIPDESSYMVDTYSEKKAKSDLKKAKKEADVSIVYLHGGKSDSTEPDTKLKERIDFLVEQGADVVICSHPHILKGYQKITRPDGKDMLVYYSLGNFVSGQSSVANLLGGMAEFTLKKDAESGEVSIKDYSMEPVVMHYDSQFTECTVYKLSDYTDELAEEHGIHEADTGEKFTVSVLESLARKAGEIDTEDQSSSEEDTSDENNSDENGNQDE